MLLSVLWKYYYRQMWTRFVGRSPHLMSKGGQQVQRVKLLYKMELHHTHWYKQDFSELEFKDEYIHTYFQLKFSWLTKINTEIKITFFDRGFSLHSSKASSTQQHRSEDCFVIFIVSAEFEFFGVSNCRLLGKYWFDCCLGMVLVLFLLSLFFILKGWEIILALHQANNLQWYNLRELQGLQLWGCKSILVITRYLGRCQREYNSKSF